MKEVKMESIKAAIIEASEALHHNPPMYIDELRNHIYVKREIIQTQNKLALVSPQRGLLTVMINFIEEYADANDTFVMVGAAPGVNMIVLAELYPTIEFYCYDMLPILISPTEKPKNVHVFHEFFLMKNAEQYAKKKNILLFCDLRMSSSNTKYTEDTSHIKSLTLQRDFVTIIKPKAWCVRFAPPKQKKTYEYLDGRCMLIPYCKTESDITMLMGQEIKGIFWEREDYYKRMFYFNIVLREFAAFDNTTVGVKGGDRCADCAIEELAIARFVSREKNTNATISIVRNYISDRFDIFALTDVDVFYNKVLQERLSAKTTHGNLPRLRSIVEYLKYKDIVDLTLLNLKKYANITDKDYKAVKQHIIDSRPTLEMSMTHKSVDCVNNYEALEFIGDGILGGCAKMYVYDTFNTRELVDMNSIASMYTNGATATDFFAPLLGIESTIIADVEESNEKIKEDVTEAYLAALHNIFEQYKKYSGMSVCKTIIYNLLDAVDLDSPTVRHRIYPPKTMLKEFFDEQQMASNIPNEWRFDNALQLTYGNGMNIKTTSESKIWDKSDLMVTLTLPKSAVLVLEPYRAAMSQKEIMTAACIAFLETLSNRGFTLKTHKPNYADLKKF